MPLEVEKLYPLNGCNIIEHAKCIYITGKETMQDGLNRKWTRHWFRMSYIGKACEKEHGRTTAVILESLFAIPHYFFIAIGNGVAAIFSPFAPGDEIPEIKASEPKEENPAQGTIYFQYW